MDDVRLKQLTSKNFIRIRLMRYISGSYSEILSLAVLKQEYSLLSHKQ